MPGELCATTTDTLFRRRATPLLTLLLLRACIWQPVPMPNVRPHAPLRSSLQRTDIVGQLLRHMQVGHLAAAEIAELLCSFVAALST